MSKPSLKEAKGLFQARTFSSDELELANHNDATPSGRIPPLVVRVMLELRALNGTDVLQLLQVLRGGEAWGGGTCNDMF
jgi:hypothetical protein